jgi:hypothetical protein
VWIGRAGLSYSWDLYRKSVYLYTYNEKAIKLSRVISSRKVSKATYLHCIARKGLAEYK